MFKKRCLFGIFVLAFLLGTNVYAKDVKDTKKEDKVVDINAKEKSSEEEWNQMLNEEASRIKYKVAKMMNNLIEEMDKDQIVQPDEEGFVPLIDIKKEADNIIVTCDLPGVEKNKIDVAIKDKVLTISGERDVKKQVEKTEGDVKIYRSERGYGKFSRSIRMPDGIDENDIKADYKNGVLIIKIKYKEKEEKKSQIKVAVQ